jgi:ferritin-like metal-binding protein YciE
MRQRLQGTTNILCTIAAGAISASRRNLKRKLALPIGANPRIQEMAMAIKTMQDLFVHALRDIYYVEKKLVSELPKMAKKVSDPELKRAFQDHAAQTENHVARLEEVFQQADLQPRGEKCEALEGLLDETKELLKDVKDPQVLDAGILAAAQAVEHYEITRYGTLVAWCRQLGSSEAEPLLSETLEEEKEADKLLTEIAEAEINRKAA